MVTFPGEAAGDYLFVLDAIAVLDNVVEKMQAHQQKKDLAAQGALHW